MNRIDFIKAAFLSLFAGGSALKSFTKPKSGLTLAKLRKAKAIMDASGGRIFPSEVVFRSGFNWVERKVVMKGRYHTIFLEEIQSVEIREAIK